MKSEEKTPQDPAKVKQRQIGHYLGSVFKVTLVKQEQTDQITYLSDVATQVKISTGEFYLQVEHATDVVMA